MWSNQVLIALEEAALLLGRLDSRISASPLAEAWQVRACILAAETLAAVDGTPTRFVDITGLLLEAPLPSPDGYRPASVGLAHWRRCMARVELGELAARLVGRVAAPRAALAEQQADWDLEDGLPPAAKRQSAVAIWDDIDGFARGVSERALRQMRANQGNGVALIGLAAAVQQAVRMDADPDYFERIDRVRRDFMAAAAVEVEEKKAALPSPTNAREAAIVEAQRARLDGWQHEIEAADVWRKPRHLGACYAVIPDRLQELGLTTSRLSCLTGATKRLGFEGRLDSRALQGFLAQLVQEAKAGMALLDTLERAMGILGRSDETKFDPRSPLPDVLYAFLLLPAVDPTWLETSLEIHKRVVQKLIKRLADANLIVPWTSRRRTNVDGEIGRESTLWVLRGFEKELDRALRRPARGLAAKAPMIDPATMLARHRDIDVSAPMAAVFERFDGDLMDLDKEFGAFFDRKWWKNRPPRKPVEAKNEASASPMYPQGSKSLYGA